MVKDLGSAKSIEDAAEKIKKWLDSLDNTNDSKTKNEDTVAADVAGYTAPLQLKKKKIKEEFEMEELKAYTLATSIGSETIINVDGQIAFIDYKNRVLFSYDCINSNYEVLDLETEELVSIDGWELRNMMLYGNEEKRPEASDGSRDYVSVDSPSDIYRQSIKSLDGYKIVKTCTEKYVDLLNQLFSGEAEFDLINPKTVDNFKNFLDTTYNVTLSKNDAVNYRLKEKDLMILNGKKYIDFKNMMVVDSSDDNNKMSVAEFAEQNLWSNPEVIINIVKANSETLNEQMYGGNRDEEQMKKAAKVIDKETDGSGKPLSDDTNEMNEAKSGIEKVHDEIMKATEQIEMKMTKLAKYATGNKSKKALEKVKAELEKAVTAMKSDLQ
jgi:hypothetical protein